jgi:phosphoglycolate phosphatase-like HAD superfamily hydrolase
MKEKQILITDLDNTLFDWVEIWGRSFSAMFNEIVSISGVEAEQLKKEIRGVHRKHGTSEYSFLIEEIPSLARKYPGQDLTKVFAPAISAYREARRQSLSLYEGVASSLLQIKGAGALVVGYTESMAFYSNYRIRRLGLDGVLDIIYSPADHDLPEGLSEQDLRKYPAQKYLFKHTHHRHTPKGELKPNPDILREIIGSLGASKEQCVYVGDSLVKDVAMAMDAGVEHAWAKYGLAQGRPEYQLLREVTHWTDADVEREKRIGARDVTPDLILDKSFGQIFDHFRFSDFSPGKTLNSLENVDALDANEVIDIWKKSVDVQQHFNDIEMKIRNLYVTLLAALGAAYGVLLGRDIEYLSLGTVNVHAGIFFLLGAAAVASLFYFMDRHWYHRLLVGSVRHAGYIEKRYKERIPELGLGDAISKESPLKEPRRIIRFLSWLLISDQRSLDDKALHSDAKIELIYKPVIYVALFACLIGFIFGGIEVGSSEKSVWDLGSDLFKWIVSIIPTPTSTPDSPIQLR